MAQPTPYVVTTNFAADESGNVSGRSTVRTARVDVEYANLQTTLSQVLTNLALIQRDDGFVKDATVNGYAMTTDAVNYLASALATSGAFFWSGAWLTATAYTVGNIVTESGSSYVCRVAHTAGVFATDLAASKWGLLASTGSSTLPTQTGNAGKGLYTDGTTATWQESVQPAELQSGQHVFAVATTSDNTQYAITLTPAITAYTDGMLVAVRFPNGVVNNFSPTLNVNGLGSKSIVLNGSSVLAGLLNNLKAVLMYVASTNLFEIIAAQRIAHLDNNNIFTAENSFTKAAAADVKPAIALGPGSVNPGWSSDWYLEQIGPNQYIARYILSGEVNISNNAYHDGVNWRAINTGRGGMISISNVSPSFNIEIYNMDNGAGGVVTAGGTYTLTNMGSLLRVEASGAANTIVRRNAAGYIFTSFLNMSANDIGTATPSRVPVEIGTDGFLSWQTLANFKESVISPLSEVTIAYTAVGFAFSAANPIGAIPKTWYVVLRCTTAEHGYAIGEEASYAFGDIPGTSTLSFSVTAATCYVSKTNAAAIRIVRKSDGVAVNLTNGSWNWVFKLINN